MTNYKWLPVTVGQKKVQARRENPAECLSPLPFSDYDVNFILIYCKQNKVEREVQNATNYWCAFCVSYQKTSLHRLHCTLRARGSCTLITMGQSAPGHNCNWKWLWQTEDDVTQAWNRVAGLIYVKMCCTMWKLKPRLNVVTCGYIKGIRCNQYNSMGSRILYFLPLYTRVLKLLKHENTKVVFPESKLNQI